VFADEGIGLEIRWPGGFRRFKKPVSPFPHELHRDDAAGNIFKENRVLGKTVFIHILQTSLS
jgi:hypothetical protein